MSDTIPAADIATNAAGSSSMSADGVAVSAHGLGDQIEAKKFLDANANISAINAGTSWFGRVRMIPPGAGGRNGDC
jgi:hypothetical protein